MHIHASQGHVLAEAAHFVGLQRRQRGTELLRIGRVQRGALVHRALDQPAQLRPARLGRAQRAQQIGRRLPAIVEGHAASRRGLEQRQVDAGIPHAHHHRAGLGIRRDGKGARCPDVGHGRSAGVGLDHALQALHHRLLVRRQQFDLHTGADDRQQHVLGHRHPAVARHRIQLGLHRTAHQLGVVGFDAALVALDDVLHVGPGHGAVAAHHLGLQPGGVALLLPLLGQQVGQHAAGQACAGLVLQRAGLGRPAGHGRPVTAQLGQRRHRAVEVALRGVVLDIVDRQVCSEQGLDLRAQGLQIGQRCRQQGAGQLRQLVGPAWQLVSAGHCLARGGGRGGRLGRRQRRVTADQGGDEGEGQVAQQHRVSSSPMHAMPAPAAASSRAMNHGRCRTDAHGVRWPWPGARPTNDNGPEGPWSACAAAPLRRVRRAASSRTRPARRCRCSRPACTIAADRPPTARPTRWCASRAGAALRASIPAAPASGCC